MQQLYAYYSTMQYHAYVYKKVSPVMIILAIAVFTIPPSLHLELLFAFLQLDGFSVISKYLARLCCHAKQVSEVTTAILEWSDWVDH